MMRFQKRRPQWDLEKLYAQRHRVQDTVVEKLGARRMSALKKAGRTTRG